MFIKWSRKSGYNSARPRTVVGLIKKTFSLAKSILTFDDESEDEGDIEPQPHLESVPT